MRDDHSRRRLFDPDATSHTDHVDAGISLSARLRLAAQVVGIVLILVGAWYVVVILMDVLATARDPAALQPTASAMAQTLNLQDAHALVGEAQVPLGRSVATVVLLVWYVVSGWLAFKLIGAGGQLVLGAMAERRDFLATMRELLVSARSAGASAEAADERKGVASGV